MRLGQESFAEGMWRERRAPPNTAWDIRDALVLDDGLLRPRGEALVTGSGGLTVGESLMVAETQAGVFVVERQSNIVTNMVAFNESFGSPVSIPVQSDRWNFLRRPATLAGVVAFPDDSGATLWAGATKNPYSTGTITTSANTTIVTGSGTSWLANVEPGMFLRAVLGYGSVLGVVASVDSNTQLTLRRPWPVAPGPSGASYQVDSAVSIIPNFDLPGPVAVGAVGTPGRLVIACGPFAEFTAQGIDSDDTFSNRHELPSDASTIGLEAIQDRMLWFTSKGVYALSNMNFDLLDEAGNPQQSLSQVSKGVVLYADNGLASYQSGLVVPAMDGIYLMDADGNVTAIDRGIRRMWQGYVASGVVLGAAAVYNGHYLLPVWEPNGTERETLVCRLDTGAWWRWTKAGRTYAVKPATATAPRKLYSGGKDPLGVDRYFTMDPCFTSELGSQVGMQVTTNDFEFGGALATVQDVTVSYDMADVAAAPRPVLAAEYSVGETITEAGTDAPVWSTLTSTLSGSAANDLSNRATWPVVKRVRRVRFRVTISRASGNLVPGVRLRGVTVQARVSQRAR